jgi:hypothetical protein
VDDASLPTKEKAMNIGTDSNAKIWLHRVGTLVGLAGIVFVGLRLKAYGGDIDLRKIGAVGLIAIAFLALLSGASNWLLARGWRHLLNCCGAPVSTSWAVRAYAISQLAKYVPGNIFQFAGRQAIGLAAGIGNAPLIKSTALELAFASVGAVLFLPLVVPLAISGLPWWIAVSLFCVAVCAAIGIATYLGGEDFKLAALFYLAFLATSGVIFLATCKIAGGPVGMELYPAIAGAYVVAWLAGLVTPGAPAGIGVRESALIFLLGGLISDSTVLVAVLLVRAISIVGDLLFFGFGSLLGSTMGSAYEQR